MSIAYNRYEFDEVLTNEPPAGAVAAPGTDLEVTVRNYAHLNAADRAHWAELTKCVGSRNIFSHNWLMAAALEHRDPGQHVRLFIVSQSNGRWLGVLPIFSETHIGRIPLRTWRTWLAPNQFIGTPLFMPQAADDVWRALLNHFDKRPAGRWALYCTLLACDDPVTAALVTLCRKEGRFLHQLKTYERAAMLPTQGGAPPNKSQRKLASRLRNLRARLEKDHGAVEFKIIPADQHARHWIDKFLELERSGWKGKAGSALSCDTGTEGFFRCVIERAGKNNAVRLASLIVNGRIIAMSCWFVSGNHGAAFKMAFDEAYRDYAPGKLLMQHIVRSCEQSPGLHFDTCSRPDSEHCKYLWPDSREMFDCVVAIGSPPRRMFFRMHLTLCEMFRRIRNRLQPNKFGGKKHAPPHT